MPAPSPDLIPITIKHPFARLEFPGRTIIDGVQHQAMEQGRFVERSVGDAMYNITQAKKDLMEKIDHYMSLNVLAIDGQFPDSIRPIKYAADLIKFIKKIQDYISEIQGLISALTGVIGHLQMLKAQMQAFIQRNLNAIATMLNQICNLHLPDLPSIPNLFGVLYFNGFAFPSGAFQFSIGFDAKFAFSSCQLRRPNIDIFKNFPDKPFALTDGGEFKQPATINPPLPNAVVADPTPLVAQDPVYLEKIRQGLPSPGSPPGTPIPPVFSPFYVPKDSFIGAMVKPENVLSTYKVPHEFFQAQLLSLLGDAEEIIADMNPAGSLTQTGGAVNTPPEIDPTLDIEVIRERLQPAVRAYAVRKINLDNVVAADYEWKITMAWVQYLAKARAARGGLWIPTFQAIFDEWITPTAAYYATLDIPWHGDPEEGSDVLVAGPAGHDPLYTAIKALSDTERTQVLWMLSYVEASLLGYHRTRAFDIGAAVAGTSRDAQVAKYVHDHTRDDLDYTPIPISDNVTDVSVLLNQGGLAHYPSGLVYPSYATASFVEVLRRSSAAIAQHPTFQSQRLSMRYVYDTFAGAHEVDSYSQFWREFVANWADLQAEDPLLVRVALNYPDILESVLNPLSTRLFFEAIKADFFTRDPNWLPGQPYPPTPFIPTMLLPPIQLPAGFPTGWESGDFDPQIYLQRPDIKTLPLNVQITMVDFNKAYADLSKSGASQIAALDVTSAKAAATIAQANAQIAAVVAGGYVPGDAGPPPPSTGGGGDPGTPPPAGGGEADVFITPEDAFTDIAAIGNNGIFAVAEKARLLADLSRINTAVLALLTQAGTFVAGHPYLTTPMGDLGSARTALSDWLTALTPPYGTTTVDTPLPTGGATTLAGLLQTYAAAYGVLKTLTGTIAATGEIFTFTQSTPSAIWVVDHNLGRFPDVTVFNSLGTEIWVEVQNISVDRLEIRPGTAITGSAICK